MSSNESLEEAVTRRDLYRVKTQGGGVATAALGVATAVIGCLASIAMPVVGGITLLAGGGIAAVGINRTKTANAKKIADTSYDIMANKALRTALKNGELIDLNAILERDPGLRGEITELYNTLSKKEVAKFLSNLEKAINNDPKLRQQILAMDETDVIAVAKQRKAFRDVFIQTLETEYGKAESDIDTTPSEENNMTPSKDN